MVPKQECKNVPKQQCKSKSNQWTIFIPLRIYFQTFRVKNAEMFQNKTARMSRWRSAKVRNFFGGNQLLCDLHKYFADVPREMCRNVPKQECKNVPTEKCKSKFLNIFFCFKILYLMVNISEMFRKSSAKRYPSKSARMYLCKNVQVSCNSTIYVWMPCAIWI